MRVTHISHLLFPRNAAGFISIAAAILLISVYMLQHVGGLAPCSLCVAQRWPHGVALGLGLIALLPITKPSMQRVLLGLCAISFCVTSIIGIYHSGIEYGWFAGPAACSDAINSNSLEALRSKLSAQSIVRCDKVLWSFLGISLAVYNAIISAGLAFFSAASAFGMLRLNGRMGWPKEKS